MLFRSNYGVGRETLQLTCNQILGDDTTSVTVNDHNILHLVHFQLKVRRCSQQCGGRLCSRSCQKLQLINTSGSFVYAYQWMSSNPEVATVDPEGLVTAQKPGTTTITALATNGQALRCAVTVNSDVGKVTLNKRDLLLRTVGSKEALTASVAVEDGVNVPITWVSSNPGVATVDASGVVTAVADGEAKITALSPDGRFDSCSVFVGLAADKYDTEEDLAEELKLPDPYVAVRMNRLS